MARVTVEDCAKIVPNRFELVALASQRAKDISSGSALTIDRDKDKDAVVALREIADGTVGTDNLKEILIQNNQDKVRLDAYGVEEVVDEEAQSETASSEVLQEIEALQSDTQVQTENDESLLYGSDDVDVDD